MTPQEKKAHSYAKDCRNVYGECPTLSRKNISRRRARKHRQYRHAVKQAIAAAPDADALQSATAAVHRSAWQKISDVPLGVVVQGKKARRIRTKQEPAAE